MKEISNNFNNKKVSYIVAGLHQYREKFHTQNRDILSLENIDYDLYVSPPKSSDKNKGDQITIPWSRRIKDLRVRIKKNELIFQLIPLKVLKSDLIIIVQENSYITNYLLVLGRYIFKYKLAYFGHGKNYQAKNGNNLAERWKKLWMNKCDWWFTYTEGSAKNISSNGYPKNKITVFNNSIDISTLKDRLNRITQKEIEEIRSEFTLNSENICVYIGGIYEEKRLEFLIESSIIIKKEIPDFILLICGDGIKRDEISKLTRDFDWIILTGPVFNDKKSAILKISKIMLLPGLVGLAVLDAFAAGIPIITTNIDYHSPEIEYLRTSDAGIIVNQTNDVNLYSKTVINLLKDDTKLNSYKEKALISSNLYSIENMSKKFCIGIQYIFKQ
jgi:glycosyltransferase involved in cell wall biosynthesis